MALVTDRQAYGHRVMFPKRFGSRIMETIQSGGSYCADSRLDPSASRNVSPFPLRWITHMAEALNGGILPAGFYAMAEQHAGQLIPDVLTLRLPEPLL